MRAAIYLRVSTDKQEADNQRHRLIQFCASRDWEIVKEYEDIASGEDPGRNGFNRMMHDGRMGEFKIAVFWAWDRITRGGIEAAFHIMYQFEQNRMDWESVQEPFLSSSSSPASRSLLLSIMSWVAEQERKRISERTKAALARRRALGHPLGRPKGSRDKKPRKLRGKRPPLNTGG